MDNLGDSYFDSSNRSRSVALYHRVTKLNRLRRDGFMKRLFLSGAALAALMATTLPNTYAADFENNSSPSVLPPSWTGFYLGANVGGGRSRETFSQAFLAARGSSTFIIVNPPTPNLVTGTNGLGSVFGGHFGYNSQVGGSGIVGVEADISATTIKGSQSASNVYNQFAGVGTLTQVGTLETKLRDLGSVRAKLGFVPWDSVLIYGTGGLAWGQVDEALTTAQTGSLGSSTGTSSGSVTRFGWSAGAGADWKIGQNVILGVLYLHYDLGSASATLTSVSSQVGLLGVASSFTLPKSNLTGDTVAARISWLFK
jgi:outer membrane immunogenic protein